MKPETEPKLSAQHTQLYSEQHSEQITESPTKSPTERRIESQCQAGNCTPSSAPMASAPMVYNTDGSVAWDKMWDTFCALASTGGPPHRGQMLTASTQPEDTTSPTYQRVVEEVIRGIELVSGHRAFHAKAGWVGVRCSTSAHALWLSEQIIQENVESYAAADCFYVPVTSTYTTTGEIKNIITVIAKTTHYWQDHLLNEVKVLMAWEARIFGAWRTRKKRKQQDA